jgi:hypothetical protein
MLPSPPSHACLRGRQAPPNVCGNPATPPKSSHENPPEPTKTARNRLNLTQNRCFSRGIPASSGNSLAGKTPHTAYPAKIVEPWHVYSCRLQFRLLRAFYACPWSCRSSGQIPCMSLPTAHFRRCTSVCRHCPHRSSLCVVHCMCFLKMAKLLRS